MRCKKMERKGEKNHSKTKQESGNETQSKDETRKFHISLSTVKDELLNVFVEAACWWLDTQETNEPEWVNMFVREKA